MADISTKETVQGGQLLSALSKLLFKGLNNIFDRAVEYEKEMGVLKQVSKLPVRSKKDGKEYQLIVKLSPIKDKDGVFYIEIECPNFSSFSAGNLNKSVLKLDKNDKEQKEFNKLIDDMLADNKLERFDETSTEEEKETEEEVPERTAEELNHYSYGPFQFYDLEDDAKTYKLYLELQVIPEDEVVHAWIDADPKLRFQYDEDFAFEDEPKFKSKVNKFIDKCGISPEDDGWDSMLDALDNRNFDIIISDVAASSGIQVTLEKVIADGHEDINLVSIQCSSKIESTAVSMLEDIVQCDEFIDSMPEGESSYIITDEGDQYDVKSL